ncbi:TPA: hypothetical protein ACHT1H_005171, partial [Klebsiella pneumoniae]
FNSAKVRFIQQSLFIAVTGLLGQVIPFEFFSGIRPAVYTKIGCRLLVNVHYISGWISTKKTDR